MQSQSFRYTELNKEALEFLKKAGLEQVFKKNSIIFLESEDPTGFFIILEGYVKISRLNRDGKEVVIAILKPGNFFGEMSILDGYPRSTDAAAETDLKLLAVKESDFHRMLAKFPNVAVEMLKELAQRIRNSDSQIKGLSILNARGKVASSLLRWARDQGEERGKSVVIEGTSNQSEMASYVGLTRETFNRNLHHLQEEGFIRVEKRNIVIINEYEDFKKIFGPFF